MENNTGYTWSNKLSDMPDGSKVKVTMYKDHADTVTTKNNPAGIAALQNHKRISKTEYVDNDGEVHEYKSNESRDLKDSIKKIRKYIAHNFTDFECWHITLTYAEQTFDFGQAAHDCELFLGRLATRYKEYAFEYFRIIEPHANGAWHIHILVKSATNDIQLKLSSAVITEVWGLGNATARQVGAIQEMINYFGTVHTHIKQDGHKLYRLYFLVSSVFSSIISLSRCSHKIIFAIAFVSSVLCFIIRVVYFRLWATNFIVSATSSFFLIISIVITS